MQQKKDVATWKARRRAALMERRLDLEKEDAVVRGKRAEKDLLFLLLIIRTQQLTE